METPHEAIDWLWKRIAWERWLTELRRHDALPEPTEPDVRSWPNSVSAADRPSSTATGGTGNPPDTTSSPEA